MKLIDCLPFFFDEVFGKKSFTTAGTWSGEVVNEHATGEGWQGKQSFIKKWWELDNGHAMGWQHCPFSNIYENPTNDPYANDAFYLIKMKRCK